MTRRATITIALVTAISAAVIVAAVALLVFGLTIREQRTDAERIVRTAATTADDVEDPPTGVTLVRQSGTTVRASPGAPAEVAGLRPDTLPLGASRVELAPGRTYQIYVFDRGTERTVAALDLRYRGSELDRLEDALLPAGLLGIAASALAGWFVARRAVRPLAQALSLQRRFVADASHELRTPLTILQTRAQLLRRRSGPQLQEGLDQLVDDARALAEIMNDLLLSAELAHRPAAREPVDLSVVAGEVVGSFAESAGRAGVDLRLERPPSRDFGVDGSAVPLRRAISALVDNALGHTPAGGRIVVTVRRDDDAVVLEVADTGSGLDPGVAAELVKRFARSADAPGQGRRFGLGLALVQEIVQSHGGTLSLTGALGQGATATISLPASGHRIGTV
jgi:signal transduction histidine kinase